MTTTTRRRRTVTIKTIKIAVAVPAGSARERALGVSRGWARARAVSETEKQGDPLGVNVGFIPQGVGVRETQVMAATAAMIPCLLQQQ
mmetsp:Transcript_694/g.1660  ORF Transcript_694/g.1660 Transcript_694/m.1660 type:complete len:88 (+) Transcript_694:876-1139(+)